MPTRIQLLELANKQANGHITELSNQLADKYAECEELRKQIAEIRAGLKKVLDMKRIINA